MPVKISNKTNPATGEITDADRVIMKYDFDRNIKLKRLNIGNTVVKKIAWYVTREELEELFTLMAVGGKKPELIEFNFAINFSGVTDVCGGIISDSISIIIETKDKDQNPINKLPEYIIIPGFGTNTLEKNTLKDRDCCPSSKPGSSK